MANGTPAAAGGGGTSRTITLTTFFKPETALFRENVNELMKKVGQLRTGAQQIPITFNTKIAETQIANLRAQLTSLGAHIPVSIGGQQVFGAVGRQSPRAAALGVPVGTGRMPGQLGVTEEDIRKYVQTRVPLKGGGERVIDVRTFQPTPGYTFRQQEEAGKVTQIREELDLGKQRGEQEKQLGVLSSAIEDQRVKKAREANAQIDQSYKELGKAKEESAQRSQGFYRASVAEQSATEKQTIAQRQAKEKELDAIQSVGQKARIDETRKLNQAVIEGDRMAQEATTRRQREFGAGVKEVEQSQSESAKRISQQQAQKEKELNQIQSVGQRTRIDEQRNAGKAIIEADRMQANILLAQQKQAVAQTGANMRNLLAQARAGGFTGKEAELKTQYQTQIEAAAAAKGITLTPEMMRARMLPTETALRQGISRAVRGPAEFQAVARGLTEEAKYTGAGKAELLARLNIEAQKYGLTAKQTAVETGKLTRAFDAKGDSIQRLTGKVAGWAIATGLIYGAFRLVGQSLSNIVEVEKATARMGMAFKFGDNVKELKALREGIFQTSMETRRSTIEGMATAQQFTRQGLDRIAIINATRQAQILANITETDAVDKARDLIQIYQAFNRTASMIPSINDAIATTAKDTIISADSLASTLARSGETAEKAGLSMQELVAITGVLGQATGKQGEVFATSFKRIVQAFEDPALQRLLERKGIQFYTGEGEMRSFMDLLGQLKLVYDQLDGAQGRYLAVQLVGRRQAQEMTAALGNYFSIATQVVRNYNSHGEAVRQNAILMRTLAAETQNLKTRFQQLSVAIGEAGLRDFMAAFIKVLDMVLKALTTVQKTGFPVFEILVSLLGIITVRTLFFNQALIASGGAFGVLRRTGLGLTQMFADLVRWLGFSRTGTVAATAAANAHAVALEREAAAAAKAAGGKFIPAVPPAGAVAGTGAGAGVTLLAIGVGLAKIAAIVGTMALLLKLFEAWGRRTAEVKAAIDDATDSLGKLQRQAEMFEKTAPAVDIAVRMLLNGKEMSEAERARVMLFLKEASQLQVEMPKRPEVRLEELETQLRERLPLSYLEQYRGKKLTPDQETAERERYARLSATGLMPDPIIVGILKRREAEKERLETEKRYRAKHAKDLAELEKYSAEERLNLAKKTDANIAQNRRLSAEVAAKEITELLRLQQFRVEEAAAVPRAAIEGTPEYNALKTAQQELGKLSEASVIAEERLARLADADKLLDERREAVRIEIDAMEQGYELRQKMIGLQFDEKEAAKQNLEERIKLGKRQLEILLAYQETLKGPGFTEEMGRVGRWIKDIEDGIRKLEGLRPLQGLVDQMNEAAKAAERLQDSMRAMERFGQDIIKLRFPGRRDRAELEDEIRLTQTLIATWGKQPQTAERDKQIAELKRKLAGQIEERRYKPEAFDGVYKRIEDIEAVDNDRYRTLERILELWQEQLLLQKDEIGQARVLAEIRTAEYNLRKEGLKIAAEEARQDDERRRKAAQSLYKAGISDKLTQALLAKWVKERGPLTEEQVMKMVMSGQEAAVQMLFEQRGAGAFAPGVAERLGYISPEEARKRQQAAAYGPQVKQIIGEKPKLPPTEPPGPEAGGPEIIMRLPEPGLREVGAIGEPAPSIIPPPGRLGIEPGGFGPLPEIEAGTNRLKAQWKMEAETMRQKREWEAEAERMRQERLRGGERASVTHPPINFSVNFNTMDIFAPMQSYVDSTAITLRETLAQGLQELAAKNADAWSEIRELIANMELDSINT